MTAKPRHGTSLVVILFLLAAMLVPSDAGAETIKIGLVKLAIFGAPFIAKEKGYFAAEGLDAEFVYFDAAPPISVAVVGGGLDFATAGFSAAFFNLASKGALRVIGGFVYDAPGFPIFATVAANRAYAAGLKTYGDLQGHPVAVTQIGAPSHYSLSLIEEKYRLDPASIRVMPLQGNANMVAAVTGGQVDAAVIPVTAILPAINRGEVKLLGWNGDAVRWQPGAVYTSTTTATEHPDRIERFLRAYRKGVVAYHDAFTGANEQRHDGPTAPEILAIIARYVDQPPDMVRESLAYIDHDARLDLADVARQIAWYKSQGMLNGEVDLKSLIDQRYVALLPDR